MLNKASSFNSSRYKKPIFSIFIIIGALVLMIAVGITIGILSDAPDGLEQVLTNKNGELWFESLVSPWIPLFSWITNDYRAAILGIVLSVIVMSSTFYLIIKYKKRF